MSNWKLAAKAAIMITLSSLIFLGSFLYVHLNFKVPQIWIDRMNAKCGAPPLPENFEFKTLIGAGYPFLVYTAYIGLLFHDRVDLQYASG